MNDDYKQCLLSNRPICGIFLTISAQVLFALAWATVKYVGTEVSLFQIVFFRSMIGLLIIAPLTYKRAGTFKGKNYRLLILRGILSFASITASFYAMINLNLGNAALLLNTAPLFVAMFAPFFLKEKTTKSIFALVVLAFVGIAFILKPTGGIFETASILGITAGICSAIVSMIIRTLHKTDGTFTITFYFTLVITIISIPFAFYNFSIPSFINILLLTAVALFVSVGQLLNAKSYSLAQTNVISPFAYLSVIMSYILEIIIWAKLPDFYSFFGAFIVITSGIFITLNVTKKMKTEPINDKDLIPPPIVSN